LKSRSEKKKANNEIGFSPKCRLHPQDPSGGSVPDLVVHLRAGHRVRELLYLSDLQSDSVGGIRPSTYPILFIISRIVWTRGLLDFITALTSRSCVKIGSPQIGPEPGRTDSPASAGLIGTPTFIEGSRFWSQVWQTTQDLRVA
jgi:hypothetical protein